MPSKLDSLIVLNTRNILISYLINYWLQHKNETKYIFMESQSIVGLWQYTSHWLFWWLPFGWVTSVSSSGRFLQIGELETLHWSGRFIFFLVFEVVTPRFRVGNRGRAAVHATSFTQDGSDVRISTSGDPLFTSASSWIFWVGYSQAELYLIILKHLLAGIFVVVETSRAKVARSTPVANNPFRVEYYKEIASDILFNRYCSEINPRSTWFSPF